MWIPSPDARWPNVGEFPLKRVHIFYPIKVTAEHTSTSDQLSYTLSLYRIGWFVWLGSCWSFIFRTGCSSIAAVTVGPSPVTSQFPWLFFGRHTDSSMSLFSTSKGVGAVVFSLCYSLLAFTFNFWLGWLPYLGAVARIFSDVTCTTGVRTSSRLLWRDETCTVSSCMAMWLAWTSDCIWTEFSLSCWPKRFFSPCVHAV